MHAERTDYLRGGSAADWLTVHVIPSVDSPAQVVLSGELDGATADRVRDAVAEVARIPAPTPVGLDLGAVTFLDSAGIHCLLDCRAVVARTGRDLRLTAVSPPVEQVLDICGLRSVFGLG